MRDAYTLQIKYTKFSSFIPHPPAPPPRTPLLWLPSVVPGPSSRPGIWWIVSRRFLNLFTVFALFGGYPTHDAITPFFPPSSPPGGGVIEAWLRPCVFRALRINRRCSGRGVTLFASCWFLALSLYNRWNRCFDNPVALLPGFVHSRLWAKANCVCYKVFHFSPRVCRVVESAQWKYLVSLDLLDFGFLLEEISLAVLYFCTCRSTQTRRFISGSFH